MMHAFCSAPSAFPESFLPLAVMARHFYFWICILKYYRDFVLNPRGTWTHVSFLAQSMHPGPPALGHYPRRWLSSHTVLLVMEDTALSLRVICTAGVFFWASVPLCCLCAFMPLLSVAHLDPQGSWGIGAFGPQGKHGGLLWVFWSWRKAFIYYFSFTSVSFLFLWFEL